jgi:serine/threonine protein kinase
MVHRDIKLENLLLMKHDSKEYVTVADFGFAEPVDSTGGVVSDPFSVVGTLNALSPEVFTHNFYSPKSDIWALASAFYTLCFQQYPVNPDSTRALYRKMCKTEDATRLRRTMASHITSSAEAALEQLHSTENDAQGRMFVDFLSKTLCIDPLRRLSAGQALIHPFLVEFTAKQGMQKAMTNSTDLKKFKNKYRLRAAAKMVGGGRYAALLVKLKRQLGDTQLPPLRLASLQSAFIAGLQSPSRMNSIARETSTAGAVASLPQAANLDDIKLDELADRGLTKQQFKTVIRALNLTGVNSDNLFRVFDSDKNGTIDYKEFVSGIAMVQGPSEAALEVSSEKDIMHTPPHTPLCTCRSLSQHLILMVMAA